MYFSQESSFTSEFTEGEVELLILPASFPVTFHS